MNVAPLKRWSGFTDQTADFTAGSTSSRMYWWDSSGKQGQWVATATFANAWERHAYVEVEVTKTYGDGRTETTSVKDFYIPANGSAPLEVWHNDIRAKGTTKHNVVSVSLKVVEVRTADLDWKPITFPASGKPVTISAPSVP